MTLSEIKEAVCRQNRRLIEHQLVILTEGNVSEIADDRGLVVIKPSGVDYDDLTPDTMVVVDTKGRVVEGHLKPSSDTPTHLEIYRRFPEVRGIAHTHSPFATMLAQMVRPIPCYGTTHADAFYGDVPVTRPLSDAEVDTDYELNIGRTIAEVLDPRLGPAVLVANHGPFAFGRSAREAVDHVHILEKVAMMAALGRYQDPIPKALLTKHFFRKHGPRRYYGQSA